MGGSAWKFLCGGGEVVAHSSVHAFQGLSPAGFPRKRLFTKSHTNRIDPAAMKNAPIVETMFIQVQPGKSGYVNVRRGIPANPSTCWIMKVRLKPITISQNVNLR